MYSNENQLHKIFTYRKITFTHDYAIVTFNKEDLFSCCSLITYGLNTRVCFQPTFMNKIKTFYTGINNGRVKLKYEDIKL